MGSGNCPTSCVRVYERGACFPTDACLLSKTAVPDLLVEKESNGIAGSLLIRLC